MITGFLINIFYILFYNVISFLPVDGTGIPTEAHDAIVAMGTFLLAYNYYFPLDVLLDCVIIVVGFEVTLLSLKIILWLIKLVRGQ